MGFEVVDGDKKVCAVLYEGVGKLGLAKGSGELDLLDLGSKLVMTGRLARERGDIASMV